MPRLVRSAVTLIEVLRSAARVAGAVEIGRTPRSRDLRTLGIDPEAFPRVARA